MAETKNKVDYQKMIREATHMEVVKYGCCGEIFAMCIDGFQDAEWDREARKYRKQGHKVELVPSGVRFGECKCNKATIKKDANPNQLSLI